MSLWIDKEYLSMEEARVPMKTKVYTMGLLVLVCYSLASFPVNSQFIGTTMFVIFILLPQFMDGLVLKISKFYFARYTSNISFIIINYF